MIVSIHEETGIRYLKRVDYNTKLFTWTKDITDSKDYPEEEAKILNLIINRMISTAPTKKIVLMKS